MNPFEETLRKDIKGAVSSQRADRRAVQHDSSIFELLPDYVVQPIDADDVERLVQVVTANKKLYPKLALTPRSAGTDMSGAAIGSSIVVEMTPHFSKVTSLRGSLLNVQPGVFVRDLDPMLEKANLQLGSVPASRALCTIGGMVGNNSGGEQSLRYGNTENWVRELKVVLADGKEHTIKPLTKRQLDAKMTGSSFEASLYKHTYKLIESNYDLLRNARPKTHKNSMGYNLWSVWDRERGIFDLTRLFTGSQGTLGIITDITIEAVPKAPQGELLLLYLPSLHNLGTIIETVVRHQPATFEGIDDITFNLGIKYFRTFRRQLGTKEYLRQQAWLVKSVAKFKGHLPALMLMVGFDGASRAELREKITALLTDLRQFRLQHDIESTRTASAPFWRIRRAALSLLRNQVKGKYASPFIDDISVPVQHVQAFLPELRRLIRRYELPATIQGHFGDGNFHIIPLLDLEGTKDQAKLEPLMREIIPIVKRYHGTMAGEHNDGMIRGPWLPAVFGDEVFRLFKQVKALYDPLYIFNPNKKTDASWDYSMSHVRHRDKKELI